VIVVFEGVVLLVVGVEDLAVVIEDDVAWVEDDDEGGAVVELDEEELEAGA